MKRKWLKRTLVLLLCIAFPCHWALSSIGDRPGVIKDVDFAQIYFGVRCLIDHQDPYDGEAPLRAFDASGLRFPANPPENLRINRITIAQAMYLPTGFLVLAPFALAPWAIAHMVWFWVMAGLLALAGLLAWDLASDAPFLAGWMTGFILLNSVMVLLVANPAGIAVPLCIIAAWCFLKGRLGPVGVALLAAGLVIKPQDAGLLWLYFLLAGGPGRKRAWQTLGVAAVLGTCAAVWIAPIAPRWLPELRRNIHLEFVPGGIDNLNPFGAASSQFDPVISMQNTLRVLRDAPGFYGPGTLIVTGLVVLAWALVIARKRSSSRRILLALAATSVLTLLPSYHRNHDAKLLLMMIPACTLLWAGGGVRRWVALGLTWAAILVTSDMPVIGSIVAMGILRPTAATPGGKLLLLALHPAPLVLLAAGCFYLWAFIYFEPRTADASLPVNAGEAQAAAAG